MPLIPSETISDEAGTTPGTSLTRSSPTGQPEQLSSWTQGTTTVKPTGVLPIPRLVEAAQDKDSSRPAIATATDHLTPDHVPERLNHASWPGRETTASEPPAVDAAQMMTGDSPIKVPLEDSTPTTTTKKQLNFEGQSSTAEWTATSSTTGVAATTTLKTTTTMKTTTTPTTTSSVAPLKEVAAVPASSRRTAEPSVPLAFPSEPVIDQEALPKTPASRPDATSGAETATRATTSPTTATTTVTRGDYLSRAFLVLLWL